MHKLKKQLGLHGLREALGQLRQDVSAGAVPEEVCWLSQVKWVELKSCAHCPKNASEAIFGQNELSCRTYR